MAWYIGERNCLNEPLVSDYSKDSILVGKDGIYKIITELIQKESGNKTIVLAIEGYIGARFEGLAKKIKDFLKIKLINARLINISTIYKSADFIKDYEKTFVTDDPSFGVFCANGWLKKLIDQRKLKKLQNEIKKIKKNNINNKNVELIIIYGVGSAISSLRPIYDYVVYLDVTRETFVNRLEKEEVVPIGFTEAAPIFWKPLYYVYYPMLIKQKKYILNYIDYYIDDNSEDIKILPKRAYDEIIGELVKYPLKFKKIFMPGPWGGEKFREYYNIPELANMAWNIEVSGMDSVCLLT